MMDSEDNIKKVDNTEYENMKIKNHFKSYQISLFPKFQDNVNYSSTENESNLKNKNESSLKNEKKKNLDKKNQINKKKKKKIKNENQKKKSTNKIYKISQKNKFERNKNQLNDNYSKDFLNEKDNEIENNSFLKKGNLKEEESLNVNYHNINSPMINRNELNDVNKSNEELNEINYMNVPYYNIGDLQSNMRALSLRKKENMFNFIDYKNNDKQISNSFKNEFIQSNENKDISKLINKDKVFFNDNLIFDNNQIYYNYSNNLNNPNTELDCNINFFNHPIFNQSCYINNNINTIINNEIIGLNFSINNNLNNILHKTNFNYNEKKNGFNNINKNPFEKNVNKQEKKYILMSDILNYPPKINYKVTKKNIPYLNLKIKLNENEDINYCLFEDDNPISVTQKITKKYDIKNEKIEKLREAVKNGINFLKTFDSYKLTNETAKNLYMIVHQIKTPNINHNIMKGKENNNLYVYKNKNGKVV